MEHNSIFDHQMSFSAFFFFKGLGWATQGLGRVQNSIITTGVIISEPDKKISAICLAICSKKRYMSIFATHKYNITSLSPVFHTGRVEPVGGGRQSHAV